MDTSHKSNKQHDQLHEKVSLASEQLRAEWVNFILFQVDDSILLNAK